MINLTETANNKIKQQLLKRGKGLGIKLSVKPSGCSGFSYVLEFADTHDDNDIKLDYTEFVVIVDKKSEVFFTDLTLDYVKNGLNEGFEFINPLEKDRCGCGESFRI